jgi:hypothetical protein
MTQAELQKAISHKSISRVIKTACGKMIGSGTYRDVYEVKGSDRYVIKIERDMSKAVFANATEWYYYIQCARWEKLSPWLAKCIMINETSQVLVMQKVKPVKSIVHCPALIPSVLTDTKIENFGWVGKRFVCTDYSTMIIGQPLRMRKAHWWSTRIE